VPFSPHKNKERAVKIRDILTRKKFILSFEVFPPKREGNFEALFATIGELVKFYPDFISVTYGAGGSNKDLTLGIASRVKNQFRQEVLAHLTCVGATREDTATILASFKEKHIENILALRGDPPAGSDKFEKTKGGFGHANELVSFIIDEGSFSIGAAGYPQGHIEAPSLAADIANLKRKVDAGADFLISQFFFDNGDFYNFIDKTAQEKINIPIIPGIIPILNYKSIKRMAELNGHELPDALNKNIEKIADKPEELEKYGIEYATRQAQDLIDNGVRGIHFYCMNRSMPIQQILSNLSLPG
jgi:methylenetetrahydrofolate reductase (NADPH)